MVGAEMNMSKLLSSSPTAHRESSRITVPEIAHRLNIGRQAVYAMLKEGIIPALRINRRWLITRHAYEQWEHTCGMRREPGLGARPELKMSN